jgi:4-aminobutyrate aminotransferase/(S)-3-amino-2-methylpropionate transaminase
MDAVEPGGAGERRAAIGAALAVLDVFEEEALLERGQVLGANVITQLEHMARDTALAPIGNIRGLGAMVAFDMVEDHGSSTPVNGAAKAITARAFDEGLVLLNCGANGEAIRILVPLTAAPEIVDEGMDALARALALR